MQKLSKRLLAAADFVTQGSLAADIGTDHGFLPIYLIQSGRCPKVIAMDIHIGPLERAREHIKAAGLQKEILLRRSDGMRQLAKGEADSVVIAGMGGLTVLHILEEAYEKLADLKELILEPQSDIAKVRKYLREHNMDIDQEDLVCECGKFYPVLHVCMRQPNVQPCKNTDDSMKKMLREKLADEERFYKLLDQYGERIIFGNHPTLEQMLDRDEQQQRHILQQLENGAAALCGQQNTKTALMRKKEVEMRLEEIHILRKIRNIKRIGEGAN